MYPPGTKIQVLRSSTTAKASPRIGSLGYISTMERTERVILDNINIDALDSTIIFTRFGKMSKSRIERKRVLVLRVLSSNLTANLDRCVSITNRIFRNKYERVLKNQLKERYKLPRLVLAREKGELEDLPLFSCLLLNDQFIKSILFGINNMTNEEDLVSINKLKLYFADHKNQFQELVDDTQLSLWLRKAHNNFKSKLIRDKIGAALSERKNLTDNWYVGGESASDTIRDVLDLTKSVWLTDKIAKELQKTRPFSLRTEYSIERIKEVEEKFENALT